MTKAVKCNNCEGVIETITDKRYPGETIEMCFCGLRLRERNE